MKDDSDVEFFDDIWNAYFHDPVDKDWTFKSYSLLHTISTPEDYWLVDVAIRPERLATGMFFIMREHVYPCWDDPSNKDGGCYSIKVPKSLVCDFWRKLICRVLTSDPAFDALEINGLSISPKGLFSIVKIWTPTKVVAGCQLDSTLEDISKKLPSGFTGSVVWRSWIE